MKEGKVCMGGGKRTISNFGGNRGGRGEPTNSTVELEKLNRTFWKKVGPFYL